MLEQGIKELLAADAAVNSLVAGRIRPLQGAQLDARPFLLTKVAGADPIGHSTGRSAFGKATVEVTSFANSYLACAQLAKEVRRVLDRVAATTSTVRIVPSVFDDETDIEETTEPGRQMPVFVRTQTYRVCYQDL